MKHYWTRIKSEFFILLMIAVVSITLLAFETITKNVQPKNFIDVSHAIEHGMVTIKGFPPPVISDYLTREASTKIYAEGTQFNITRIDMVANTGTYIDAPFGRYEDGDDLAELSIDHLAYLPAVVIRVDGLEVKEIDESYFQGIDLRGRAVLINTNWSKNWGRESYFENHPHLTEGAAKFLIEAKVKIVGIDSYNIDGTTEKTRPVHSILLRNGIPIVEHLCDLEQVPSKTNIEFNAVPVKLKNFSTFPVRAFVCW